MYELKSRLYLTVVVAMLVVIGCEKPAPAPPVALPQTTAATTAGTTAAQDAPKQVEPTGPPTFAVRPFEVGDVPASAGVKGTPSTGLRFTDRNGDNLAVFSVDAANTDLYVTMLRLDDGAGTVVREVKQMRGECEFDYSAEFLAASIGVTELDGDDIGEVSFAYKYSCRSDVSPLDYKVMVLEGDDKAVLRGSEILIIPGEEPIGDGKFEAEGFDDAPRLLEHARKVWKAGLVHDMNR